MFPSSRALSLESAGRLCATQRPPVLSAVRSVPVSKASTDLNSNSDLNSNLRWPPRSRRRRVMPFCVANSNGNGSDSSMGNGHSSVDGNPPGFLSKSRRDMLLEYVKTVQPEFMELFIKRAPKEVVEAMRQTVTNMMGTLPPQFFAVNITTVAENLAQLMYSVMMTGYMFRNAQFRLDLQRSLSQVALPSPENVKSDPNYALGSQKKVSGEVIRWHKDSGPERIEASQYIELLESEVEELKSDLARLQKVFDGPNQLLDYLRSLEPQNIQELTTSAGEDALEAMNTFVQRLVGMSDPTQLKRVATETTAVELAKLLYWLMVVGYSIRNIEVRYDMEKVLGVPVKLAELPPGERI